MWADRESQNDYLNFGEVSELTKSILETSNMLPVSIGIYGDWGAGKSSLLKILEADLKKDEKFYVINFDAWLYQGFDDARSALLETIVTGLNLIVSKFDSEPLKEKAKRLLNRVNKFRAIGLLADSAALAFGIPTGGLLAKTGSAIGNLYNGVKSPGEYGEALDAAKEGIAAGKTLFEPGCLESPPEQIAAFRKEYGDILAGLKKPVIVIIDNLDRCMPANAIQTLEAIRLFLFMPQTAFIIAADEDMIKLSVSEYFKGASSRHQADYLDKLIQIPIHVPKAGVREIRCYLFMLYALEHNLSPDKLEALRVKLETSLQEAWKSDPITEEEALKVVDENKRTELANSFGLANRIAPILATSSQISGNPRIVKRMLNTVKMRSLIAKRRNIPLDEGTITKLVVFERCAGNDATKELYNLIDSADGKPKIIGELERLDDKSWPSNAPASWSKDDKTKEFIRNWSKLAPPLEGIDLRSAVYLARETIPIGYTITGLSINAQKVLSSLLITASPNSKAAASAAQSLTHDEPELVMEGIISSLRTIDDWSNIPNAFNGACILADSNSKAAALLCRFIASKGINKEKWAQVMLKNKKWYKE